MLLLYLSSESERTEKNVPTFVIMAELSVFMVAEKPSICTSIASALSQGTMDTRGRSPPVHEFHGTFQGKRAFFR